MDDYDNSSPYFGVPTPELDQAWLDLVQCRLPILSHCEALLIGPDTPIVLSKEEFKHYNKDGILLGDDSGYLATITMYHDMHCIVRL